MHTRKFVAVAFCGAIAASVFRHAHGCTACSAIPVTRFVSTISYQGLHVARLDLAAPQGMEPSRPTPPERPMDDPAWRWPYMLLCIALSLAIAILMTYLVERPISRFCLAPRAALGKAQAAPRIPARKRADRPWRDAVMTEPPCPAPQSVARTPRLWYGAFIVVLTWTGIMMILGFDIFAHSPRDSYTLAGACLARRQALARAGLPMAGAWRSTTATTMSVFPACRHW